MASFRLHILLSPGLVVFVHRHASHVCWMPNVSSPGFHATLNALAHLQVHVFDHKFAADFYGKDMNVLICGFLRCAIQDVGLPRLLRGHGLPS